MKKTLAVVLFFTMLVLLIALGPIGIGNYIDPPSMVLIVILPWLALSIPYGFSFPVKLIKAINQQLSREEAEYYEQMIKHIGAAVFSAGLIGTFMGIISMLGDLSDPNSMGGGLATSLITVLYALIVNIIFIIPIFCHFNKLKLLPVQELSPAQPLVFPKKFFLICFVLMVVGVVGVVIYQLSTFMGESSRNSRYTEFVMDTITVNTQGGAAGQHFVQVELTLHLSNPVLVSLFEYSSDGSKSLEKVFKSKVIDIIRVLDVNDLNGVSGQKEELEAKLLKTLNETKNEFAPEVQGRILRLFLSQYTIQ